MPDSRVLRPTIKPNASKQDLLASTRFGARLIRLRQKWAGWNDEIATALWLFAAGGGAQNVADIVLVVNKILVLAVVHRPNMLIGKYSALYRFRSSFEIRRLQ